MSQNLEDPVRYKLFQATDFSKAHKWASLFKRLRNDMKAGLKITFMIESSPSIQIWQEEKDFTPNQSQPDANWDFSVMHSCEPGAPGVKIWKYIFQNQAHIKGTVMKSNET